MYCTTVLILDPHKCSVFFHTWAARESTSGIPLDAFILKHPQIAGAKFAGCNATKTFMLNHEACRGSPEAAHVLPQLSYNVEAAEEASATSTMKQLKSIRRHLDDGTDARNLESHATSAMFRAVMKHTDASATAVKSYTTQEIAALRAEVSRLTDIIVLLAKGKLPQVLHCSAGRT